MWIWTNILARPWNWEEGRHKKDGRKQGGRGWRQVVFGRKERKRKWQKNRSVGRGKWHEIIHSYYSIHKMKVRDQPIHDQDGPMGLWGPRYGPYVEGQNKEQTRMLQVWPLCLFNCLCPFLSYTSLSLVPPISIANWNLLKYPNNFRLVAYF